jgi:hypothetical protein
MWKRLMSWLERDLAVQHLENLEDRMLADIGVTRDDLREQVMGTAPEAPKAKTDYIDTELCIALAARF